MRFFTLPILTVFACGLLVAAQDSEIVTYVDGNITDFAPNSGATLSFASQQAMELRTPLHVVQVPYASISKAELGAVKTHSPEPEPLYKVWALHKRWLGKSETQLMTVAFKNGDGQEQNMTLEMPKPAASSVLATIEQHTGTKTAKNSWWGDSYWKTTRNADKWGGAGTVAQK